MNDKAMLKVQNKAQEISETWKNAVLDIQDLTIDNDEDYANITDLIKEIAKEAKDLDKERKSVTDPLNATIRKVNAWFKPGIDALEKIKRILKTKIGEYELAKKEEQRRLVAAAVADRDGEKMVAAAAAVAPQVKGVTNKVVWRARIVDESLIPEEYWVRYLDERKLQAMAGPDAKVPGVEFYEDVQTTVRT